MNVIYCFIIVFNFIALKFMVVHSVTTEFKHFIIYGQSLSTGFQSYPAISTENIEGNYMVGDQVWTNFGNTNLSIFSPLISKTANQDINLQKTRISAIQAECPIVGAVNHIQSKLSNYGNILASSCGYGGKTIEQLSKESTQLINYYNDYTKTINNVAKIAKGYDYHITCPALVWMQGEYNYVKDSERGIAPGLANCISKDEYKHLFLKLKNNMQGDLMAVYSQGSRPFFITYQVGAQFTNGKTLEIGMAQIEAANENDDIICAGPVYQLPDRGGHLDPNGYRWYGEMIGKAYLSTITTGAKFKPLQPLEIARTNISNTIRIKFLVPKLPLVLDVNTIYKMPDYGFVVYLNDVKQVITSVSIDNDCVNLICQNPLIGKVEVVYAGVDIGNRNGHGNLRDSDDTPALYTYVDLDAKNNEGDFIYPRDLNETTLRPVLETKDEQGMIYGKPYPLYNFCVAFYYKLDANQQLFIVPHLTTGMSKCFSSDNHIRVNLSKDILSLTTFLKGNIKLEIFSVSGSLIKIFEDRNNEEYFKQQYNLVLPGGLYFARVSVDDELFVQKIVL